MGTIERSIGQTATQIHFLDLISVPVHGSGECVCLYIVHTCIDASVEIPGWRP